jgi:DNA-directed RNA polymerase subunit RPC12/RpoP
MPLIRCHECSGQVSDHARTCPHCGAPVIATIKRRQKRELQFLLFKLAFAAIVGIVAWFAIHHVFNMALAAPKNLQQQQSAPH